VYAREKETLSDEDLRPSLMILAGGSTAVLLVSALTLPWPAAVASVVLGVLMIAGADVDARTYLLPDVVTWSATVSGIIAALLLDPLDGWSAGVAALLRGLGTALILALLRHCYARLRARQGLGFGDIKLAAAVGAWLPLDVIPLCFCLASSAAIVAVTLARLRDGTIDSSTRLPFGAFLCPALWLIFYISVLSS
jgi:leader peptidase (prepilin peptidase)/N-methyltransferase